MPPFSSTQPFIHTHVFGHPSIHSHTRLVIRPFIHHQNSRRYDEDESASFRLRAGASTNGGSLLAANGGDGGVVGGGGGGGLIGIGVGVGVGGELESLRRARDHVVSTSPSRLPPATARRVSLLMDNDDHFEDARAAMPKRKSFDAPRPRPAWPSIHTHTQNVFALNSRPAREGKHVAAFHWL